MKHQNLVEGLDELFIGIDRIDYHKLEKITSDNIFIAILENDKRCAHLIASIDNKIYDFSKHVFLDDNTVIRYAKSFSDIMPDKIWRLIHINNYDIICIDIDDDEYYLIKQFEDAYYNFIDENAKSKVLKHNYNTKSLFDYLPPDVAYNLTSEDIFLAIINDNKITLTQEQIDFTISLLRMIINEDKLKLSNTTMDECIDLYLTYLKEVSDETCSKNINFVININNEVYNLTTHKYINLSSINYMTPIDSILKENQWQLLYDLNSDLYMIYLNEDAIDSLIKFESNYKNKQKTLNLKDIR